MSVGAFMGVRITLQRQAAKLSRLEPMHLQMRIGFKQFGRRSNVADDERATTGCSRRNHLSQFRSSQRYREVREDHRSAKILGIGGQPGRHVHRNYRSLGAMLDSR